MTEAKAKRIRARVGDVFEVPLSAEQRVYGQIVDQADRQFLVVLFRLTTGAVEDIVRSGIALGGIVFDAKWRNGDWPIVAKLPPVMVRPPWFVVGDQGLRNVRLVNFDSSVTREASAKEAAGHHHRHISYPMALQWAAEALHGHREWMTNLDHFRDLGIELGGDSQACG